MKLINQSSRCDEADGVMYARTHSKRSKVGKEGSRIELCAGSIGEESIGSSISEGGSRRSMGRR